MVSPAAIPALDTVRDFATPEHIAFQFRLAGPMARAVAWAIDLGLRFIVLLLALFGIGLVSVGLGLGAGLGLWLLLYFIIDWLSGGLCEWLWQGRTPGKRLMGIRVVGVDGLPAGAGACFLRNVLRAADWLPVGFVIGLVAMIWSGTFQRLGDFAAGTLVVYDQHQPPPRTISTKEGPVLTLANALPPETASLVDGAAARAIAGYVARRRDFHPQRRAELAGHLARPLRRRLDLARDLDPDLLLCAVYLVVFQPGVGRDTGGKAAAVLTRRRPDWQRLEALVAGFAQRGSPATAAADLSRLYRGACADLALANAYHLPAANVAYLHQLVARAHLRFYRRIVVPWRLVRDLVLVRVPGTLYGDSCLRVAMLAFFGVFLGATLLGAVDPGLAERFLGEGTIDSMREMYADAPRDRDADSGAVMSGFYIQHNVGIAMGSFASGVFAGIGSLVTLVFNGLYLGLVFGFMTSVDPSTRDHFFEFVAAHGPFELTGITLAGAAGLRLGLGLIATGGLPRLESLRRAAANAVPIMAVAAALVALAAPIEAFVSPSSLPIAVKRGMGVLCAVILGVYFVGLGGRAQRILAQRAVDQAA